MNECNNNIVTTLSKKAKSTGVILKMKPLKTYMRLFNTQNVDKKWNTKEPNSQLISKTGGKKSLMAEIEVLSSVGWTAVCLNYTDWNEEQIFFIFQMFYFKVSLSWHENKTNYFTNYD